MRLTRTSAQKILILILLGGGFLRLHHVAWDEGHHVHPDERFISMVEEKLGAPGSVRGLTLRLRPGRYEIFCNMAGHYMGGMHAVVLVG